MVAVAPHHRDASCTEATPGGGSRLTKYRYDAWNRLVAIDHEEGESVYPVAAYQYNALHHRVLVRVDQNPEDSTHTLNQQRVLYYSPAWQVLEERIDDNWSAQSSTVDRHVQHVWGALYIDDILLHREDGNVDGDYNDSFDSTWYHLTDPQFSTVAILDLSGAVIERVSYDAWGDPRHHPKHDFDGDGDFDQDDADALDDLISSGSVPITSAKYRAEMDIDRDGDVDSTDQTLRGVGGFVAALPKGALSTPGPGSSGGVDSTVGWSGYRYDQPTRLYAVRFRFYDAVTFRWLNRDPAGYVDSMNLYGYGVSSPLRGADPFGLGGPFFAGGVTLDGEVITYDQIKMRGMGWEFRIYHALLGFSDGWLDFFTFGGYTFARDALGLTPDWLQEESGWYRAGWWVGFGSAAALTVAWAWTRPAWHYTTAEGAAAIGRSGTVAATTRNLFGVRGVYGTIIPPALMARFPWLAILIGRTPAEVAWAVRLYGAAPHWLIPWWRFVWGPVRLAGSGVAAAASVMATSIPFQPRNSPSSSIDVGGVCLQ